VGDKGTRGQGTKNFLVPLSPCPLVSSCLLVSLYPMITVNVGQYFSGTIFRRQVYVLRSL